jgi:hypothetical protein
VPELLRSGFGHGGWVFRPAHVIVNAEDAEERKEAD